MWHRTFLQWKHSLLKKEEKLIKPQEVNLTLPRNLWKIKIFTLPSPELHKQKNLLVRRDMTISGACKSCVGSFRDETFEPSMLG